MRYRDVGLPLNIERGALETAEPESNRMYVCSELPALLLGYQNKLDCDQGTIIPWHCRQSDGFKAGNFPQISSFRTHKQTVQIEPPPPHQPLQDDRALSVWTVIIAIKKAIWRRPLWMEDWLRLGDQSGTISIIPQTPHHHICSNGECACCINPIIRLEWALMFMWGLRFIVAINNYSDRFLIAF